MREIGKQQVTSEIVTITGSTYTIDYNNLKTSIVNLCLNINVAAVTITAVNFDMHAKLQLMCIIKTAGAVVTFDSSFDMSDNNDAALSGLDDMNTYILMGDMSGGGLHQIGTMGKIAA